MQCSWEKIVRKDYMMKLSLQYIVIDQFLRVAVDYTFVKKSREKRTTCSREKFNIKIIKIREKNSWEKFNEDIVVHFILYEYLRCYLFDQYF
jgi:small-conductance mechanosensitive channel